MSLIEIDNVKKKYGRHQVLKDVSISIDEGCMVGILGGNGCGKSTLLSVLAGIRRADGGKFLYGKKQIDLFKNTKLRSQQVAYVPQDTPLIEELSAWDNLRMWYSPSQLKKSLADGVLGLLGINDFLKVPVKSMSGGMKKRLSIGCAIHTNPSVLLLDEPTAALDLSCKQKIYDYFDSFRKAGGVLILATHEIQEIQQCDCCYIISDGVANKYHYDGDFEGLIKRL